MRSWLGLAPSNYTQSLLAQGAPRPGQKGASRECPKLCPECQMSVHRVSFCHVRRPISR